MTDTQTEPADLAELAARVPTLANGAAPVPIHVALSRVMGDVQGVGKHSKVDPKAGGFSFRGVDAVVNAVGPALRKHGVLTLPRVLSRLAEDYSTKGGTVMRRTTIEVEFTFVGPDGSTLVCSACGESADAGDKSVSKSHSVAYRTALLEALCIPTNEPDPDYEVHERATEPEPEPVDAETLAVLRVRLDRVKAHPEAADELRDWWQAANLPPIARLTAEHVGPLAKKLGRVETVFGLLAEAPGGAPVDRPLNDPTPEVAPTTPEPPETPTAPPGDVIAGLLASTSPKDGDVAGWLIGIGEGLPGAALRQWFRAEGLDLPAGPVAEQRRAWALAVHDRLAVATVRVLSGFGLGSETLTAVER